MGRSLLVLGCLHPASTPNPAHHPGGRVQSWNTWFTPPFRMYPQPHSGSTQALRLGRAQLPRRCSTVGAGSTAAGLAGWSGTNPRPTVEDSCARAGTRSQGSECGEHGAQQLLCTALPQLKNLPGAATTMGCPGALPEPSPSGHKHVRKVIPGFGDLGCCPRTSPQFLPLGSISRGLSGLQQPGPKLPGQQAGCFWAVTGKLPRGAGQTEADPRQQGQHRWCQLRDPVGGWAAQDTESEGWEGAAGAASPSSLNRDPPRPGQLGNARDQSREPTGTGRTGRCAAHAHK